MSSKWPRILLEPIFDQVCLREGRQPLGDGLNEWLVGVPLIIGSRL
jgi:hypothetical protein